MNSSLRSGSSISHYRVISPLGAGGMGEVYLAQDETLERAVALKVLPRELTKNEERVRRFIQEAKSASSLSHPHIVTIYEIGRAEVRHGEAAEPAADEAPIHFIAMELVSGETLREKIHHEKTDLRTLIRFLAQAADGLAKAHAAGIIHRDLKPENIMVTKDGYAKVLDFGLAKLTERREPAANATHAPTATREQTREGAVVGTAAYMSPEQVQAKPVDHRSDIFSFGCILYEAAGRTKPFSGDSDVEVMHKILRDKPPPIEDLNPEVPAELRRLIRRCMAKAPDQRLQSMKDLALELVEIADEYEELSVSVTSRGSGSQAATPVLAASASERRWQQLGLAFAVVAGLAGTAFGIHSWLGGGKKESAAPAPFQSMRLTRFTSTGKVQIASISPDGKYLANVVKETGRHSLWVKQVATGSDVQIVAPLPTPFRGVSFSPDGNYVYYVNQETKGIGGYSILYQVPVLGGTSRKLIFDVDTTVSFSPDGKRLAFLRGYPQNREAALMVANADGTGERRLAVRRDPEGLSLVAPSWSPDGRRIAVFATSSEGGRHAFILMVDAADGTQTPLPGQRWWIVNSLAWVPDGSGLVLTGFGQNGYPPPQVWFAPFPEGEPRRITNDLNDYQDASVTSDGKIVAATQVNRVSNLWIAPAGDAAGAKQITFGSSNEERIENVHLTSDAVVFKSGKGGRPHVWSVDFEGRYRTQLTPDGTANLDLSVSRDGGTIAFESLREDGLFHIWRMDRDGGNAVQITHGKGENLQDVSPDGRWMTYTAQGDPALMRLPIEGGTPVKLAEATLGDTAISPDGKRVTCIALVEEGGRSRYALLVLPAEGGKPLMKFLWPEGFAIQWAPAGDALTYAREIDGVGNLWSQPLNGGAPHQITHFSDLQIQSFDWSPDGKVIGLSRGQLTSDVVLITDFR